MKSGYAVLVGVFSVYGFAGVKVNKVICNSDNLFPITRQMHFDTILVSVIKCTMSEPLNLEVCIQFTIKTNQYVFVECFRYFLPIVITAILNLADAGKLS